MTRVLIVEDERALLRALAMNLTARGYEVTEAETGTRALSAAAAVEHDVIVLDLGLPDLSGLDVIRGVRAYASTPIIVLSARTGSSDKVAALDLGADDYVTKPFSIDELLARLRAATRRAGTGEPPDVVQVGDATRRPRREDRRPTPTARRCTSRRPSGTCSRRWCAVPASWSPDARC